MSTVAPPPAVLSPRLPRTEPPRVGPIGRLGRYTATHFRTVLVAWLLVALVLGFFAPRVEKALSGAGWEASGSQSVQARKLIERDFAGLGSYGLMTVVYSSSETVGSPAFKAQIARVEAKLRADAAVRTVVGAGARRVDLARRAHGDRPGRRRARPERDGRRRGPPEGDVEGPLARGGAGAPDRRGRDVVGLQRGQPLGDAEVGGDLVAGDARDHAARVRLARRRRAAVDADDGRPARRRRLALPRHADHADLDLGDELRADVRAGARHRLRAVHRHALPRRAVRLGHVA